MRTGIDDITYFMDNSLDQQSASSSQTPSVRDGEKSLPAKVWQLRFSRREAIVQMIII